MLYRSTDYLCRCGAQVKRKRQSDLSITRKDNGQSATSSATLNDAR
jgi:hypothetical protein